MPRGGRSSKAGHGGNGRGRGVLSFNDRQDSSTQERGAYVTKQWRKAEHADDTQKKVLEKKMLNKYHYLKFVEKVKVERKLKSCRKKLVIAIQAAAGGQSAEVAALRKELKQHTEDLEYIEHYPKHIPYNSLFPKEDTEASRKRRDEIRSRIKKEILVTQKGSEVPTVEEEAGTNDGNYEDEDEDSDFFEAATEAKAKPSVSKKQQTDEWDAFQAATKSQQDPAVAKKLKKKASHDVPDMDSLPSKTQSSVAKVKSKKKQKAREKRKEKRELANQERQASKKTLVNTEIQETLEARPRKESKRKNSIPATPEVEVSAEAPEGTSKVTKKKRKKGMAADDNEMHPSWAAAKSAKSSGALVAGGSGKRVTFDDED
eukprot:gnl/MRDRNA2_/MRDRNA2_34423_c0_seq1.p1 gnl/MRDRNA2_/MRDRNA2_34423_c0~~gnl/MRDRNA2_/MRDRNA2_34423_c0_seq1.p1  ORF type:complete len:373 (+),score=119.45 gnl/MRDRNA2_/MRDRNA2_34423_c0_seq1:98-1216(+)